MTTKENLLIKVYELENELSLLNGEGIIDIEERQHDYTFHWEARKTTVSELKERIERLERRVASKKQDIENEARKADFLASEEGQAKMQDAIERRKELGNAIAAHKEETFKTIEGAVKGLLGEHWGLLTLSTPTITIGIVDENGNRIFGQSCEIHYEEVNWPEGREEFSINFGTCGSFDIMDGEAVGSFSRFHIDLCKLLSNKAFLEWLKGTMKSYTNELKSLYKKAEELNAWIKNPVA